MVRVSGSPLRRHELDDLYGTVLVEGLEADAVVLTGPDAYPAEEVGRLARDLVAAGRLVVGDLSGAAALEFADGAGTVLKMSHEELVDAGVARDESLAGLVAGARRMLRHGTQAVVVSRAAEPVLVVTGRDVVPVMAPHVSVVASGGAGDSMTAALAVGLSEGLSLPDAVRLGVAAGTLNVARRGLGSGSGEHVRRLARAVDLVPLAEARDLDEGRANH